MKLLVFQHIDCEHPGIFRNFMEADDVEWDTVELDENEVIPDFSGYDALMVMGGPMDVWQTDQHPWLVKEIEAIEKWVRQGRPYLGFCLGHQLLAVAMGGKVGPSKRPEIGVLPVSVKAEGKAHWLFKDCAEQLVSLQWHSAEVTQLPEHGTSLAESAACAVNAMSWGERAVSVQFHVELTDTTIAEWGKIPQYAEALEGAMGSGAMEIMQTEANTNMVEFNKLSSTFYQNFVGMVNQG